MMSSEESPVLPVPPNESLDKTELLQKIRELNIIPSEIKNFETGDAGEHCTSRCTTVTVNFVDEKIPLLELFVKKSRSLEEKEDVWEMFDKEKFFYNSLLPDIDRFGRENLASENYLLQGTIPKVYYASTEMIIMENLFKQNYQMLPEVACHRLPEARKGIEALARFHAPSYAFINEMGLENFLEKYPFTKKSMSWSSAGNVVIGSWVDRILKGAVKILKSHPVPGSEEVLQRLTNYGSTGFVQLCQNFELDTQKSPCGFVINHGDLWNCNFLFRRPEESPDIDKCVILDFQGTFLGSPSLDLQYYFFVTIQTTVRRKHWRELLKIYYDTFTECVEGFKGRVTFSFEDLLNDVRDKSETGFVLGLDPFYFFDTFGEPWDLAKVEGTEKGDYYAKGLVESFEEFKKLSTERD